MFGSKTEIISKGLKEIEKVERYSAYFGKEVYSKSGEFVGKVYDIGMQNQCFMGIFVKGKRKVLIEKSYIASDKDGVIMLNIEPVTNLIGKQVFDSGGKMIGKVVELERKTNSNNYEGIVVKKSFFRRSFSVPKKDIESAKQNIILNKSY
jgi:sporulation protein YlmC with PRC-barrel domain